MNVYVRNFDIRESENQFTSLDRFMDNSVQEAIWIE